MLTSRCPAFDTKKSFLSVNKGSGKNPPSHLGSRAVFCTVRLARQGTSQSDLLDGFLGKFGSVSRPFLRPEPTSVCSWAALELFRSCPGAQMWSEAQESLDPLPDFAQVHTFRHLCRSAASSRHAAPAGLSRSSRHLMWRCLDLRAGSLFVSMKFSGFQNRPSCNLEHVVRQQTTFAV